MPGPGQTLPEIVSVRVRLPLLEASYCGTTLAVDAIELQVRPTRCFSDIDPATGDAYSTPDGAPTALRFEIDPIDVNRPPSEKVEVLVFPESQRLVVTEPGKRLRVLCAACASDTGKSDRPNGPPQARRWPATGCG